MTEGPVEGGVVGVAYHPAHILQRGAAADQFPGGIHPLAGQILVKGFTGFSLEHLGDGGDADLELLCHSAQSQLLVDIFVNISADPAQQVMLSALLGAGHQHGGVFGLLSCPVLGVLIFTGQIQGLTTGTNNDEGPLITSIIRPNAMGFQFPFYPRCKLLKKI